MKLDNNRLLVDRHFDKWNYYKQDILSKITNNKKKFEMS